MRSTTLSARRLITADTTIEHPRISIDADGIITAIESGDPTSEETTLTATFFDIHVHGAAGHDAMQGTSEALAGIGAFLATKGVANYLATTVTAPIEPTLRALEGIANAISKAHSSPTRNAASIPQPTSSRPRFPSSNACSRPPAATSA
jgi:N-acetylglucosamine-6-phosphate deacetylase